MFDPHALGLFILAGLLLNLTPGPDVLYIVARSTSQGRGAGIVSALGIGTGCLVHILAAACGLSALMAMLPLVYRAVRYAGAVYLIYLGVRALLSKTKPDGHGLEAASLNRIFLQGVLTNVLNPKVALFFLAFLPQFTDSARGGLVCQFLVLGFIFDFNGTLVNIAYALVASKLGDWLRTRFSVRGLLNRLTGGLFIAIGLRLALADKR
jgi:threonine/homoserine/homoserine lactone efflux protein